MYFEVWQRVEWQPSLPVQFKTSSVLLESVQITCMVKLDTLIKWLLLGCGYGCVAARVWPTLFTVNSTKGRSGMTFYFPRYQKLLLQTSPSPAPELAGTVRHHRSSVHSIQVVSSYCFCHEKTLTCLFTFTRPANSMTAAATAPSSM